MSNQILGIGSRIKHEKFGIGAITKVNTTSYGITFFQHGNMELPIETELEIIEAVQTPQDMISVADVVKSFSQLLDKYGGISEIVELGGRWEGGTMILKPANENQKPKEIPIETFFHKIVMTRDRLRVMEQRVNSSSNLSEEEKVNLEQYIYRIYGSLTTFNILFKNSDDHFRGTK